MGRSENHISDFKKNCDWIKQSINTIQKLINKMKIVHIIGALRRGGAERFVVDLCNELAKNDHYQIYLISLCDNDADTTFLNEISGNISYLSLHKGKGLNFQVLFKLTSWLVKQKADVVHTHLNAFEYLLLYRFMSGSCKFFHTIHSTAQAECPNFLIKAFRKTLYKKNKVIPIAVSNDGGKSFKKYYGLDNVIVIENGRPFLTLTDEYPVLIKRYKENINSFLLIHVGRIMKVKNQQLLIEAVQKFNANEEKKCKLLIIGDVRDESVYHHLYSMIKDDPYVEFVGGKENIADFLSMADFFCLSSFYEGMPISLIEALSVGCISICTKAGGVKDMIKNEETGFLSNDNSVDSYYQTIKRAVFYPDKQKIKENSLNSFKQRYHIGTSCKKHVDAYLVF
ncbi:glycosyltransferase family 4 protein [Sphingobacterium yanglingense]|uniref:Glycosyltransferase involved in cell wall biosynthesis n=1 Tax=Sphingobacterium yanglingense TaxID=1437280 RepID=A0A4R6WKR7_9SPHI|nr:glycosyltransferase family 4 protein [Sphingobacterium yanglingense]TDQ76401.1 glycosyltransferase involved in cell wall biosynthesis [Sphingobacterium yanglingense]